MCNLEQGTGIFLKINMYRGLFFQVEKRKKKRVQGKEKGEVFILPAFIVSTSLINNNLGTFHCYDYVYSLSVKMSMGKVLNEQGSFLNQDFLIEPQANSLNCKMINVAVKFKEKIHPLQGSG